MSYRAFLIFGIGTVIAGLSSLVQAQTIPIPSDPSNSDVTLSGESLTTVEGRTSTEDYEYFFPETAPPRSNGASALNTGQISISAEEDFASFLEKEYGVVIGDTIRYPEYMEIFRSSGDTNSTQSIRFKIPTNSSEQEE